ncbi:pentapeptide repeat-containing protein [Streptomyces sp. A475]|uniref:pentapeptide repeat-containing protein n=1 Tax=Streptomyces sp. A475 TaxID=3131976 RepID=UPI0030C97B52
MIPLTTPLPSLPSWPYCAQGADPTTGAVGCRGLHVSGHTACLAHLSDADRDTYLAGLAPGADIDHRGTPFTEDLLSRLLSALCDITGHPQIGEARFDGAQFTGEARFDGAQFSGTARFSGAQVSGTARFSMAQFTGTARFGGARFSGLVWFGGAQFTGEAWFDGAQFTGTARFSGAQFSGTARFSMAQFTGEAWFSNAQFTGEAWFGGAQFSSNARFSGAQFTGASELGPLVCAGVVDLSGAVFEVPVTLEIAAGWVRCVRTRWESTATVRLRYASADLGQAALSAPVAVTAHPAPFTFGPGNTVVENSLSGRRDSVRVTSIQGADASHLVLTDTDLTGCLFSGAFHLDQLRLEGRTIFAPTPAGWHRRGLWPARWTRRRTLAEEHHWRAQTADQPSPHPGHTTSPRQWRPGPNHPDPGLTPDPEDVAALYRQLRRAFEDGKNEPGAADFYYGECEMRRHDHSGTPKGERRLLWGYWLLSGYGLRALRAFTWLLAAMSLTVLLLMRVGLPTHDPDPATPGTLHGSKISLHTSTPDPALHGTWSQRMTWDRAEKATRVAVNSVVFRSSGQNLTTIGTYIEMVSRLLEPTLLALGVLAVRGRIKR